MASVPCFRFSRWAGSVRVLRSVIAAFEGEDFNALNDAVDHGLHDGVVPEDTSLTCEVEVGCDGDGCVS